ncbi:hypothetical protein DIPPA_06007 [Diplonema papillatum]|nr:hypothetical protein DIPPA_06007 [Diplonema papillatum]
MVCWLGSSAAGLGVALDNVRFVYSSTRGCSDEALQVLAALQGGQNPASPEADSSQLEAPATGSDVSRRVQPSTKSKRGATVSGKEPTTDGAAACVGVSEDTCQPERLRPLDATMCTSLSASTDSRSRLSCSSTRRSSTSMHSPSEMQHEGDTTCRNDVLLPSPKATSNGTACPPSAPSKSSPKKKKGKNRRKRSGWLLMYHSAASVAWRKLVWRECYVVASVSGVSIYKGKDDGVPLWVLPIPEIEGVGCMDRDVGGRDYCFALLTREARFCFQARCCGHRSEWLRFYEGLLNNPFVSALRRARGKSLITCLAPATHSRAEEPPQETAPAFNDLGVVSPDSVGDTASTSSHGTTSAATSRSVCSRAHSLKLGTLTIDRPRRSASSRTAPARKQPPCKGTPGNPLVPPSTKTKVDDGAGLAAFDAVFAAAN